MDGWVELTVALTLLPPSPGATGVQPVDRPCPAVRRWRHGGAHHAVRRDVRQALRRLRPDRRPVLLGDGPGLVDRLRVQPGEKALDIGSGRGAVTRPLAEDVGPTGRVDAVDLAPGMVRLLGEDTAHLAHVHVTQSNAADPRPPAPPYDVIASSMVIFFLDDPTGALTRWRALLRPGGRVGVATFQPWYGTWAKLVDLYDEFGRGPAADRRPVRDRRRGRADPDGRRVLRGAHRVRAVPDPVRGRRGVAALVLATPWAGCGGGTPEAAAPRDHAARHRVSSRRAAAPTAGWCSR